jgi:uncharacterized protein with ParB-like and HNH nuclease domain
MSANNLSELFSQRVFRIPDYQRGYAWGEKQLSELWDDLDDIAYLNGEFKKHYTGTIYLEEAQALDNEKWLSGYKFYNIVDGQQRITSISILLFELLKAADLGYAEKSKEKLIEAFIYESNLTKSSRVYKFSYSINDKNYSFLANKVFEDEQTVLSSNYNNAYTKNLSNAKFFFREKINALTDEQRDILFKKISTSLMFDMRTIEKDLDVQAVFETMNNRGKPLSTLEKLKNRLIYLTEKLKVTNEDKINLRNSINTGWGEIYSNLAQNPELILDEDVFLSAHLSLYRNPKDATFSEKLAEEKVFQMFCNKSEKYDLEENGLEKEKTVSFKKIQDYILKLSALTPYWYEAHNSENKLINKILVLNSSKEIKIFLAVVLKNSNDNLLSNSIFSSVESILFRNRVPGIGLMDERTFASWARDIYNEEITLEKLLIKINEITNSTVIVPNLINSFNSLFTYERGNKGFHRWSALKYFLFEYDDYLRKKSRETNDKVTLNDFHETTIEHIIPRKFQDYWTTQVSDINYGLVDEELHLANKVILNTLGNLTILKNGKNSSVGNNGWSDKKDRFRTGSYNEIAISTYDIWTKKEIHERGLEMLRFLETKVKGLSLSHDDIKAILYFKDDIAQRFEA